MQTMEPIWLFDFANYLSKLDPTQSYCVNRLSGGLINETIRAAKNESRTVPSREGRFPDHDSLILKYAPPYVAALGESVPFSQSRQAVEVAALELFALPDGPLSSLRTSTSIQIPRLLRHDPVAKILVLSDLGRLSDLTAYLSNSSRSSLPSFEASTAKIVGERLGHFFGLLHSRRTYQLVSQHSNIFKKPDPSARDLVYNVTIESIPKYLSKHGISEVETTELHRRIDEDFSRLECEEELGFILGDAWTGTVLIDPSVQGFALSVIDWEFAGFGSGVASDVAQFLAHLQLALLSAEATLSPLASVIQEVMTGFVRTYRRCSDENQMFWTRPMDVPVVTRTIRSAFLLHGREIINNANELQWTCTCCSNKQDDIKEQNREHSCQLKSQMVEAGIWYLRAAGADEQEFAQKIRTGKVSLNDAKALGYLWQ